MARLAARRDSPSPVRSWAAGSLEWVGGCVGGQTDTSQPPVQIRNGSHSSPELQGRLGKWSDWDCLTGWWRRLARVLSLVYCQYYRPHVAISPEFRGRASDQSSDCWAPVSQCFSDQPDQRTPPFQPPALNANIRNHKGNFDSSLIQIFIWQLETL